MKSLLFKFSYSNFSSMKSNYITKSSLNQEKKAFHFLSDNNKNQVKNMCVYPSSIWLKLKGISRKAGKGTLIRDALDVLTLIVNSLCVLTALQSDSYSYARRHPSVGEHTRVVAPTGRQWFYCGVYSDCFQSFNVHAYFDAFPCFDHVSITWACDY